MPDPDKVDYLHTAEELMNRLSSVELEPHPHFRILPSPRRRDAPRLWDVEERNEIGYILEDKNDANTTYLTTVHFRARVGLTRFCDCILTVEKKTHEPTLKTQVWVEGNQGATVEHSARVSEVVLELIGGTRGRELRLKVVKDVKKTGRGVQVLFKLGNETESARLKEGRRTYSFGNLLDFSVYESANHPMSVRYDEIKSYGLLPVEDLSSESKLSFRDYYIRATRIPRPKSDNQTIADLSKEYMTMTGSEIDPAIRAFVERRIESTGGRLYGFQNRAILNLGSQLVGDRSPCLIIARTAAGKTEAFLIPIVDWILRNKGDNKKGISALFFYPTKALAADQLQRIVEFLHFVNSGRSGLPVTVGVYHGDIEERQSLDIPLPLRCVLHESDIRGGKIKSGEVRLRPDTASRVLKCPRCGENYHYVLADRYTVTMNLPDILICTPDVINYILMQDKRRHVFFGSPEKIRICQSCKAIRYEDEPVCNACGSPTEETIVNPEISPEIVLLDELHLFSSVFGGNASNLLKRLSAAIRLYSKSAELRRLQYVATSATVRNPSEFGSDFFGRDVSVIEAAKEEYDYSKATSKVVIFATPRAYRMIDSISYTLYELLKTTKIRALVFVNSLRLCGMLLSNIKQRLSADQATLDLVDGVDGHNSTYTRQERAETEERFNRGEIRGLIATSTLEVGVDFKDLDGMILYGAPHNFNNYLQRIGRAGRNNDSIIINFLNPTDPIDLFYYRNAVRLSEDPTEFIEYPPLPAGNEVLAQKHVLSSLFDACTIFNIDTVATLKTFRAAPEGIDARVRSHLAGLWKAAEITEASNRLRSATLAVISDSELPAATQKRFSLMDLRKVDETVRVDFEEPYGMAPSRIGTSSYLDQAYRRAGLTYQDRDLLRKIRKR